MNLWVEYMAFYLTCCSEARRDSRSTVSKRYEFLTEFAIYLRCDISFGYDMSLRDEKGIHIISHANRVSVYRICEANISHGVSRISQKDLYERKDNPRQSFDCLEAI